MIFEEAASRARALATTGDLDAAAQVLTEALEGGQLESPALLNWAHLAEEIGALDLALSLLRRGAKNTPDGPAAAELALLEEDLGVSGASPDTPDDTQKPPAAPDAMPQPSAADRTRLIHLFSGREGVYARQWVEQSGRTEKTGYSPIRAPLTPAVLDAHLAGRVTVGTYAVRHDQTVTWFVFDLDLTRKALAVGEPKIAANIRDTLHEVGLDLSTRLTALGLPTLLEDSGYKGRHLWGLLDEPLPADLVHRAGRALVRYLKLPSPWLHLEFFPKQGRVPAGGLGNLVKLPLGVHLRSGRRSTLLDATGQPSGDPWTQLREIPKITRAALLGALAICRDAPLSPVTSPGAPSPPLPEPRTPSPTDEDALGRVLTACPVLCGLVEGAFDCQRLTHDEQVVLTHSLGHFEAGIVLLQRLFLRCPEVPLRAHPKRAQRGHPISCARIRSRLPGRTARANCHCAFDHQPGSYPNPTLHGVRS